MESIVVDEPYWAEVVPDTVPVPTLSAEVVVANEYWAEAVD